MNRREHKVTRGPQAILRDLNEVFPLAREMTGAYGPDAMDDMRGQIDRLEPEVRACVLRYGRIRAMVLRDSAADLGDAE